MTNPKDGWSSEWAWSVNPSEPKPVSEWKNSPQWVDGVNKAFDKEFGIDPVKPNNAPIHPSLTRGNYLTEADWKAGVAEYNLGIDKATHNTSPIMNVDSSPIKVYNNRMPTHDPYTNPNAHIYYQCECGAILDPCTKSFAELNNAASREGWKVRWNVNGAGYKPHCVKCGEGVE